MLGPKITLTVQNSNDTNDGMGGKTRSWANNSTTPVVLGTLRGLTAREREMQSKLGVKADLKFLCDYHKAANVSIQDRFRLGSRIFAIVDKDDPFETNLHLEFTLQENT
jgi:head-tail adaptor